MSEAVARIGRPRRFAIDVAAVLNLVGVLAKYLGLAVVFPIGVALWYSEPVWPFLVTGAATSAFGFALERVTRGATRVGVREGFLVVSAMLLMTAAFASLPYLLIGGEQLDHPIDAYLEGMSAATTTGASVVTDFDELSRSLSMWRQFTQWLGGMGIIILAVAILPRLRVGGRQMMDAELPGPEIGAFGERIRSTARLLWGLYIGLTVRADAPPRLARLARNRRRDDAVRGARARVLHDADGRLLDEGGLDRGLLAGGSVDHRALHAPRGRELRAPVPRSRPAAPTRLRARRGVPALPGVRPRRLDRTARAAVGIRHCRGRGGRPGGGLPGHLGHHDDGVRDGRLRALARHLAAHPLRSDVRGRLGGLDHGLDQGRAPSPPRQGAQTGARSDASVRR